MSNIFRHSIYYNEFNENNYLLLLDEKKLVHINILNILKKKKEK